MNRQYVDKQMAECLNTINRLINNKPENHVYNLCLFALTRLNDEYVTDQISYDHHESIDSFHLFIAKAVPVSEDGVAAKLAKLNHSIELLYNIKDERFINNLREFTLDNLGNTLSLLEEAAHGTDSVYQEFTKLKLLILEDKWPSKKRQETKAIYKYLASEQLKYSAPIVEAAKKACKSFDGYYDYLDPSYFDE